MFVHDTDNVAIFKARNGDRKTKIIPRRLWRQRIDIVLGMGSVHRNRRCFFLGSHTTDGGVLGFQAPVKRKRIVVILR